MNKSEQLSALIGHIYDATLDSTLWVLDEAAQFVGASASSLHLGTSKDARTSLINPLLILATCNFTSTRTQNLIRV